MQIPAQVSEISTQHALLQPSNVKIDQTLEDLGTDSLSLVESIFAIEEAFDITVPFNANDPNGGDFDITTVGSIIKAVQTLVQDQT